MLAVSKLGLPVEGSRARAEVSYGIRPVEWHVMRQSHNLLTDRERWESGGWGETQGGHPSGECSKALLL
jgi:hypothetical protein